MLTRLAVVLALVLAAAACGKKTAPKAPASAPIQTETTPTDETEGDDAGPSGGETMQGDPCDGGEATPDE